MKVGNMGFMILGRFPAGTRQHSLWNYWHWHGVVPACSSHFRWNSNETKHPGVFFPIFPVPFAPSPAQIGLNQPVALCRSSPVTSALTWNSWAFVSAGATDPASPAYRCWSPTRLRSNVAWAEAEQLGDELVRNRRCDMMIIRIVVLGLDTLDSMSLSKKWFCRKIHPKWPFSYYICFPGRW